LQSLSYFISHDTANTAIYTLSLHDALPILSAVNMSHACNDRAKPFAPLGLSGRACQQIIANLDHHARLTQGLGVPIERMVDPVADRKSTRLNSSHDQISYAVFCLKKKNKNK